MEENLELYQELIMERPNLFDNTNSSYRIVLNKEQMKIYEQENKRKLGVVYKSAYNMMLVDLVEDDGGNFFPYERIVPSANGIPVVVIPVLKDRSFLLLRQYRHAIRREQFAFPRGFGENGIQGEENARRELFEEIGAEVNSMQFLGKVIADSGLSSSEASVYLAEINESKNEYYSEGIREIISLSEEKFSEMVRFGKIDDGFSLAAFALYREFMSKVNVSEKEGRLCKKELMRAIETSKRSYEEIMAFLGGEKEVDDVAL